MRNPFRRAAPHEVLTDPESRRVNATLNQRAIRRVTLYEAEDAFLKSTLEFAKKLKAERNGTTPTTKVPEIKRPTKDVANTFLELSSTDGGEHRKDLVEMSKAQNQGYGGFAVPLQAQQQQKPLKGTQAGEETRGGGLSG